MDEEIIMKVKKYYLIVIFYLFMLSSMNAVAHDQYNHEFRSMYLHSCDTTFHKLEEKCSDMVCRDYLVDSLAECWKRSMNNELNKRLLKLKSINASEFDFEMNLQKKFNQAVRDLCGKNCLDPSWPTVGLRGIPYNFCRVDAYKYRTAQAIQINKNQLSIPRKNNVELNMRNPYKRKTKDTGFFNMFTEQLCKMPRNIWNTGNTPVNCQEKAFSELNDLEFTDDVCDRS